MAIADVRVWPSSSRQEAADVVVVCLYGDTVGTDLVWVVAGYSRDSCTVSSEIAFLMPQW